jgi:hypothetical protein
VHKVAFAERRRFRLIRAKRSPVRVSWGINCCCRPAIEYLLSPVEKVTREAARQM